ncbi:hypothetical protein ES703_93399 [subsurface metagenome]
MSEELARELFEALKQTSTALELNQMLDRLRTTDVAQAEQIAANVLQLLKKYADELAVRSENKKAAFQFYTGAEILREFFPEKVEDRHHWLLSTAAHLENAAETYREFDDIDGASACVIIASLLRMLTGEFTISSTLDHFLESLNDSDYERSKHASGIVYIPYDLIASIEEEPPDPVRLHRADQYVESYLLQVQLSSLFTQAIRDAVDVVRKEMTNRVKLPKLTSELTHARDLVFGDEFECRLELENRGEGPAQNVRYSLSLDKGLELVKDGTEVTIGTINPNEKREYVLSLVCGSSEGAERAEKNITLSITYEDVLQNRRSTTADYQMEFLTYRRSDALRKQIDKTRSDLLPVFEDLRDICEEKVPRNLVDGISELSKRMVDDAAQLVEEGEFERVETLLQTVDEMVRGLKDPIKDFVSEMENTKQMALRYSTQAHQALRNTSEALQRVKAKAEELLARA